MFRRVPYPLRLVAVDRRHAGRQRREVEADDREAVRLRPVAQDRHREFGARQGGLDEIGMGESEFLGEEFVGFESGHAAEETKSLLHSRDGGWFVPLGERVARTWRLVGGAAVGFLVVSETDAHVVSGTLLQKRPLCGAVRE